jgi:hypothetical protein
VELSRTNKATFQTLHVKRYCAKTQIGSHAIAAHKITLPGFRFWKTILTGPCRHLQVTMPSKTGHLLLRLHTHAV